jgi:uncharacterized membrane protein
MLPPANLLGVLSALASALIWGGADFSGGYATRRGSQYHVLTISALSGLLVLIVAALLLGEAFPSLKGSLWAMLGGAAGALGIAALYRALSMGHAASVAPTAAVIGAALPVLFSAITQGLPDALKLAGFALALVGIWMVSSTPGSTGHVSRPEFVLACLAGIGFGFFFIFLGQVEAGKIFTPLILARSMTFVTGLALLRINRLPLPAFTANPLALLAGVLDAGGNLFFLLAKQYTRLDIAVVLSSLYPASTVILSSLLLKEKITPIQWVGVLICLGAIGLITQ